jgi:hypothetical protein
MKAYLVRSFIPIAIHQALKHTLRLIKLKPNHQGGGVPIQIIHRLANPWKAQQYTIIQHKGSKISVAEHSTLAHLMNLNLTANVTLAQPTDLRKKETSNIPAL